MKKSIFLLFISIFIGYYAIPALAQKAKKEYNLHNIHKAHWRDSYLLREDVDILLTKQDRPSSSADEATILNAIIPDFQVNENAGPNGAVQFLPAVSSDGSGNFVITWIDYRNEDSDIYAQRFLSNALSWRVILR